MGFVGPPGLVGFFNEPDLLSFGLRYMTYLITPGIAYHIVYCYTCCVNASDFTNMRNYVRKSNSRGETQIFTDTPVKNRLLALQNQRKVSGKNSTVRKDALAGKGVKVGKGGKGRQGWKGSDKEKS